MRISSTAQRSNRIAEQINRGARYLDMRDVALAMNDESHQQGWLPFLKHCHSVTYLKMNLADPDLFEANQGWQKPFTCKKPNVKSS